MKDGDVVDYARWCATCKREHGILYLCPHYPKNIQDEIKNQSLTFEKNLKDEKWCKKQIDSGIPQEAITIFKLFAGI